MGNNFSHITNSCKVDNEGSSIYSTIYSDEELLFSEEEIKQYVLKLILKDDILSRIVNHFHVQPKKLRSKHNRPTNEKLWNSRWVK